MLTGIGDHWEVKVEGAKVRFEGLEEFEFFLTPDVDKEGNEIGWTVIEPLSGTQLACPGRSSQTPEEAERVARELLAGHSPEAIRAQIQSWIARNGKVMNPKEER